MIARLEKSFRHIAEFSSHVAHELKTPLAIMRGESEVTLRKERDVYASLLRAEGFGVVEASNAPEAYEILKKEFVDLV